MEFGLKVDVTCTVEVHYMYECGLFIFDVVVHSNCLNALIFAFDMYAWLITRIFIDWACNLQKILSLQTNFLIYKNIPIAKYSQIIEYALPNCVQIIL